MLNIDNKTKQKKILTQVFYEWDLYNKIQQHMFKIIVYDEFNYRSYK